MADYQHILFACDFTEGTNAIADKVLAWSGLYNAKISCVHAIEPIPAYGYPWIDELEDPLIEEAKNQMATVCEILSVTAEDQAIEFGSVRNEILQVAADRDADLITLGSHGRHGIQRILGSGATSIVNHADCDVLIVRSLSEAHNEYKTILFAVDLSDGTAQVATTAQQLAEKFSADLHLVHVIEPVPTYGYPGLVELEGPYTDKATSELNKLADKMDIDAKHRHMESGPTKREVVQLAKNINADLIVVGSHGHHGLSSLLGSTASAILHGADCDVLTIRLEE